MANFATAFNAVDSQNKKYRLSDWPITAFIAMVLTGYKIGNDPITTTGSKFLGYVDTEIAMLPIPFSPSYAELKATNWVEVV